MNPSGPSIPKIRYPLTLGQTKGGSFAHRIRAASHLLRHRDLRTLTPLVWETLFGAADMLLLRLDLESFRSEHLRRRTLRARPVEPRDEPAFFNLEVDGLTGQERRDVAARLFMLRAGVQTCYVVEDAGGNPCFLQWLIPFSENEKLRRVYGAWYPRLRPGDALIEHAYVLPKYRGTGLLPCAAGKILEIARDAGVRRVLTFIPRWNANSYNSFKKLGFTLYQLRSDRKLLGFRFRRKRPAPCTPPSGWQALWRCSGCSFTQPVICPRCGSAALPPGRRERRPVLC